MALCFGLTRLSFGILDLPHVRKIRLIFNLLPLLLLHFLAPLSPGTDDKYTPGYWKGQPEAFVRDAMVYMTLVKSRFPKVAAHLEKGEAGRQGKGEVAPGVEFAIYYTVMYGTWQGTANEIDRV